MTIRDAPIAPTAPAPTTAPRRAIRALHVYSGNLYGGIEAVLATLARQRGHTPGVEHEFAVCTAGRLTDELRDAGAAAYPLVPARFSRPWTVLGARRRLARLLKERRPDVVVAHACWTHALLAPTARRSGSALVFWMHDRAGSGHWTDRLASRTPPDLAIVNSRFTAESLPRLFPGARHEVLYNPVAPPVGIDRAAARARHGGELGAGEGDVVILQASRMEPWKGHSLLVAALARLRDRPGWAAWIAGGAQRPHEAQHLGRLRAEVEAAGLSDRVRFLGQRSDVAELLAAADVHCQANLAPEPFGIAFVEALHAGLPVVSTRMGGVSEIVTDECGILVPPDDPDALADALAALIADPARRARLGAAGPARARALCDPSAVMGRLEGLLAGLVRP